MNSSSFARLRSTRTRLSGRSTARKPKLSGRKRPADLEPGATRLTSQTVIDFFLPSFGILQFKLQHPIMRNNPDRPYLPHNQHLHSFLQPSAVRQKSMTVIPFQPQPPPITNHLSFIQNLEVVRKDQAKPKIQFNYTPPTPKFGQQENLSVKTRNSSPQTILSPEKSLPQLVQHANTSTKVQVAEQKRDVAKQVMHFSKPILKERKLHSSLVQKKKQAKSKTINNKYEVIAEVLPTLEVSRHERDEEMAVLKRQLNEARSQNNQLRTEVLRWEKKFEEVEENNRVKTEQLMQQIKQLKIELHKAQNEKLLAQVSETELQKKIKKMMQENEEREKLEKVRAEYLMKPFPAQKERVYQNKVSYQPYIQLFVNQQH